MVSAQSYRLIEPRHCQTNAPVKGWIRGAALNKGEKGADGNNFSPSPSPHMSGKPLKIPGGKKRSLVNLMKLSWKG